MSEGERTNRLAVARERHKRGDFAYAYDAYQRLLSERPSDPIVLHYLGLLAGQTGHNETALELLSKSLAVRRDDPQVLNDLGQVYAATKQHASAAGCFRRASELDPSSADILNNLGNAIFRMGDLQEALSLYRRAIVIDPKSREGHYNLGKALRDSRAFGEAIAEFERAAELDAGNYRAHYELALCLEELGRFDEATSRYQAALRAKPNHARSIANLLTLRTFDPDPAFVQHAEELAALQREHSEGRAKLHQGIGKYCDRVGSYDRAFHHFSCSKAIQHQWATQSPKAHGVSRFEPNERRYDERHFLTVRNLGDPSSRPVFIVGMPRSGTTLVEQIIASHPDTYGGGELMEIPKIAALLADVSAKSIRAAAQRYLDYVGTFAPATATRVTDKLPLNYRHLGVIATLFPNASIIHCSRDPRDIALSCFIEMFSINDQEFTTLEGIARAIVEEARLMRHWRAVIPNAIYEVDYRRLIFDQAGETRRLLEFCQLAWDDRCLAYFQTNRHVDTPSRWQVRQPVFTSSCGRWRNYEKQLAPALDIFRAEHLLPRD